MRDAPGQLSDGFEFLRLDQLLLESETLGNVLHDHVYGLTQIAVFPGRTVCEPPTDSYSDNFSVFAPPIDRLVAASCFGELLPESVSHRDIAVKGVRCSFSQKLLRRFEPQHAHEGGIDLKESSLGSQPANSMGRVLHHAAVMLFAFPQCQQSAILGLTRRPLLLCATNGRGEPGHLILQNVIGDAPLDAIDGQLIAEAPAQ